MRSRQIVIRWGRTLIRDSDDSDAIADLRNRIDDLDRVRRRASQLAPEIWNAADRFLRTVNDVVERDDSAAADERAVHLVVLPDAVIRVVAIDEEKVDWPATKNLTYVGKGLSRV